LFRGTATGSLKVIDVDAKGRAKVVYDETNITASYPPKAPEEGYPGLGDARTYQGAVELFTTALARRFYSHERK
jgi:hypothetical protein